MTYIELSGWAFNIIVVLIAVCLLWVFAIWPLIEAISMLRWWRACEREYPESLKLMPWHKVLWASYELFGRQFYRISHRYGEWMGVGNWRVYRGDEQS